MYERSSQLVRGSYAHVAYDGVIVYIQVESGIIEAVG